MLNAVAIDDEPLALEVIKSMTLQIPFVKLTACFTRALEAMVYLQQNRTDLLFLDVRMPDITGIDFIRTLTNPPMVIFTTAYSDHAVHSFELDAVDYLLKPFSLSRFLRACNKAAELDMLKKTHPNIQPAVATIFIKSGYEKVKVTLADIRYVETLGNYVQFVLGERKIISRLTMTEAVELLGPNTFIRIHRSYLVAKSKITKIDKRTVWLDSTELPVGEAFLTDIEKILNIK